MIYVTSTIHHSWNRRFNARLCEALEKKGMKVYLPQRDTIQDKKIIFKQNHKAIKRCIKILAIAQNESPNWGVEIGFSYALGKEVIALTETNHQIPLMAQSMFKDILRVEDLNKIADYIDQLIESIKNR